MRIHHVALRTNDLAALERFYAGTLGLAVTRRTERGVWLDAGGAILMLEARDEGEPAIDPATKELVCFAITPEEHARFAGLVPVEDRTAYTLYFRDPDGRRVGLSAYPTPLADGPSG